MPASTRRPAPGELCGGGADDHDVPMAAAVNEQQPVEAQRQKGPRGLKYMYFNLSN